jgi:hypothetical protein
LTDIRIDRVKLGKVSKTPEGFLKGDAVVTRTGVFVYHNMDGTERRELRHPKDVLISESLETLKSLPITNDHPSTLVNVDNADSLVVGMTGETVKIEEGFVAVSLNITHKDAIEAINNGKHELSAGYRVDLIEEVGEYEGEKYTHRQTNINYNHIACVDKGRAGAVARLNLDGAFIQCEEIKNETKEIMTINKDNEGESLIEKLAETVIKTTVDTETKSITEEVKEVKALVEGEVSSIESESNNDSIESVIEKLRAENEMLKSTKINVDSLVAEKAIQRVLLLNKAASIMNTDGLIDKTEREIMESAIKSRLNCEANFADKSDDYVAGRFDAVIEDNQYRNIKKQMTNLDMSVADKKPKTLMDILKAQHAGGK